MKRQEKLQFLINGSTLTYTVTDVTEDEEFISFIDKFGGSYSYRKSFLVARLPVNQGGS